MALFSGTAARNMGIWGWQQGQDALGRGQGILDQAQGNSLAALGQARNDLSTNFQDAIDRLNPWADAGRDALGVYQGSLGLGGDAARDSAVAAYRASPGYERRVNEATDAVARKASALGALGSGNTMQAISDRANYLADEDYGQWQGQLSGLSDRGQQAATVQGGFQGQLGQSLAGLGQAEAGLHQGYAGMGLDNLWKGTNVGVNAVQQGQQQAQSNVMSGLNFGINALGSGIGLANLAFGNPGGLAGLGKTAPKYTGVGGGSNPYTSTGGWY